MDKSTEQKYAVYRCLEPGHTETNTPWFGMSDVCPCNPELQNPTGRGRVGCGFGVQFDQNAINRASNQKVPLQTVIGSNKPNNQGSSYHTVAVPATLPKGSMFPGKQNPPPQTDPRPLIRIGQEWRSGWA
jgi:hypothetical protein